MADRIRIAMLGLSPLEIIGMREALRTGTKLVTDSYRAFSDLEIQAERYDGFIVEAGIFVSHLEFFMPRRQKTLVISAGMVTEESMETTNGEAEVRLLEAAERFVCSLQKREDCAGELSAREVEVIREVAQGRTNKEIADSLCISVNTVITHRKNIAAKLGIKSASGLSLYAVMNGIV